MLTPDAEKLVADALLLLSCGSGVSQECADTVKVPFAITGSIDLLGQALGEAGWVFALASPPSMRPVVFDPMCRACALVEMPELVAELDAKQRRAAH